MLALGKREQLIVKNMKTASRRPRRDVTAGKTNVGVSRKNRVRKRLGFVAVRVHRIHREDHWLIGREGSSDNFVGADESAGDAAIEAVNEASGVSHVRIAKGRALFHRAANFPATRELREIIDATTELVFRPGATRNEESEAAETNRKR